MSASSRTMLFTNLRRIYRKARIRNHEERSARTPLISRRSLLKASSSALMSASLSRALPSMASSSSPRIVIVGAGIAGLNAAYTLKKAGIHSTLYEASSHIGGRIQTNYNDLGRNLYVELGGEFIDSDHDDMLSLADEFGLGLIDTQAPSEDGLQVAYFGEGRLRSEDEMIAAFQPLAAIVEADYNQTSDNITYNSHSNFDRQLDLTNLQDYLTRANIESWLYKILEAAYVNEYGLELVNQSSLNFVWTIGTDTSNGFEIYGESDQRYKILGGNHLIPKELARRVSDRTKLESSLEAIKHNGDGTYQMTFQTKSGALRDVIADFVILCIPFTILRNIDIRVTLPASKKRAINELGYGTNAKMIMGFENRNWRDLGYGGDSYADLPYQSGWDSSRLQTSTHGAYTAFAGGQQGLNYGLGTVREQSLRLLPGLDQVFPGTQKSWTGKSLRVFWPDNPFVKASYACYTPGQWTSIRGAEGSTVGKIYFAGEHTSLDWQGFMNGGAESGRIAAEGIISRLS